MRVFLVQHGMPVSREENPERPLSPQGAEEVRRVAQAMPAGSVRTICHSGKLRAAQTAEILARHLGVPAASCDALSPLDDPLVWADRLQEMGSDSMLVGHLPHLARLAGLLLCGEPEAVPVSFSMGGVVCIERMEDRWSLRWMLVPELTSCSF